MLFEKRIEKKELKFLCNSNKIVLFKIWIIGIFCIYK